VLCTDTPPGRLPKPERSFFDLYFITFGRLNRALLIHQLSPPVVQGAVIHGESAYVSRLRHSGSMKSPFVRYQTDDLKFQLMLPTTPDYCSHNRFHSYLGRARSVRPAAHGYARADRSDALLTQSEPSGSL